MNGVLHLLLFVVLIPGSWQKGCTQGFDTSRCISKVYCEYVIVNVGWIANRVNAYDCQSKQLFQYNGYNFAETIYILKNLSNVYADLEQTTCRQIITVLDLSKNEYDNMWLPNMPHLRVLNISENLLTKASLHSSSKLDLLTEIDLSHNTINTIEVDNNFNVFRKLKKIYLSNNFLVELQDYIFTYLTELEYLDLSYNFIDSVNNRTFEGLKKLENLNLKHNKLTEIGASFYICSKLKNLDLSENKIDRIDQADFEKLVNLETLNFNSNLIKNIENNVFSNNKALKILNLSNNLLENIANETFKNLSFLVDIDLSINNLKILPKNLFKDNQISNFRITKNKLEGSLVISMFEGMKLITLLDLSNQQLESVEGYAFYGLKYLKSLSLNNNRITTISKTSFNSLRSLENLDLSNNQLTNIEFDKDDLASLTSLTLQNNLLTQIKQELLDGLNNLQFLSLSSNQISGLDTNYFKSLKLLVNFQIADNPIIGTIEEGTFNGLTSLPSLDISKTLVTAIENGSFTGMTQLRELNLSHSEITELQFNSFIHTGVIETIDLSFNQLTDFNINTTELGYLEKLILSNNFLTSLSDTCLKGLPRLTDIILSRNQLESIDDTAFENLVNVRYLDISYNSELTLNIQILANAKHMVQLSLSGILRNITFSSIKEIRVPRLEMSHLNIQNVSFLGLKNINDLDDLVLSNNNISKLDSTAFSGVKSLRKLDLSHNKITFIQPGAFKDNSLLYFLNLSHNMLTSVSYGIFRGLIYLDTIDLSYNEISDLKNERFYEVRSLTVLIADHNKITNVSAEEFLGTNLKSLSIGDNPMPCHILVHLKRTLSFKITALKLDESSDDEAIDGVTCNIDKTTAKSEHETEQPEHFRNEKLLLDIKEILLNISLAKAPRAIVKQNENLPNDKVLLDIKDILHNISLSKLHETSNVAISNNDSIFFNMISKKIDDTLTRNNSSDSYLIFIGICVFLILIILLYFILYQFYNYAYTRPKSHTTSNMPLCDSIENSSL